MKPSGSSNPQTGEADITEAEEVDLLWKLGKRQEASAKIEGLVNQYPNSPVVLATAAFIYMDRHQIKKAKEVIERLKAIGGDELLQQELQAQLFVHEGKWPQAYGLYEDLHRQSPEDKSISEAYAQAAAQVRHWAKAKAAYAKMLHNNWADKKLIWVYRQLKETSLPEVGSRFSYYNRPDKQEDYVLREQARWGLEPRFQFEVGATEEFYHKEREGTIEEIDEMVASHFLKARFFHEDALSLMVQWDTAYNNGRTDHGGGVGLDWQKNFFSSRVGYEANQLTREPIEAFSKQARFNQLQTNNRVRLWQDMEIGNETTVDWYQVDGSQNALNGEDNLGHKITYDHFWQIPVVTEPFISLSYHFKRAHWDKKFNGAEGVLDFLADEQVHSPGIYFENHLGTFMDCHFFGSYSNDTKRQVDYVYWSLADNVWIKENVKFSVLFEFIEGDSGVAGRGDSQVVNAFVDIYF